jgi:hypothetical protein
MMSHVDEHGIKITTIKSLVVSTYRMMGIMRRLFAFFGSRRSALAVLEFTNACNACAILVRRSATGRPGRGYFQIVEGFSKGSSLW